MSISVFPSFPFEDQHSCVCGVSATVATASVEARDQDGGGTFSFLKCESCGTFRVSPRPDLRDIGKYYPSVYRNHSSALSPVNQKLIKLKVDLGSIWWGNGNKSSQFKGRFFEKVSTFAMRHKTPLAFIPPEKKSVFEIGTATGLDLLTFKEAGWEVAGCELSEKAVEVAKSYGLNVIVSSAEGLTLTPNHYGCIHLNNVFEHLHEPLELVKKAHTALVTGGKIVLVIPNHDSLAAKLFGASWPGFDGPRHLWGFTPRGITELLSANNFIVEQVSHMPAGVWSWLDCWLGAREINFVKSMPRVFAKILAIACIPFGVMGAALGYGDTIRVVGRKQ
jgi:SAM-dependent methyltransferase